VIFGGVSINPRSTRCAAAGHRDRHSGPTARPRTTAHARPAAGRDLRPRRSRPHARHGLSPDIRRVIALLPQKRQNLLFSATFPDDIRTAPNKLLQSPVSVGDWPTNAAAPKIEQAVYFVDKVRSAAAVVAHRLRQLAAGARVPRARSTAPIGLRAARARWLERRSHPRQQEPRRAHEGPRRLQARRRTRARRHRHRGRGLDIDQLPHVVNYELPEVPRTTSIGLAAPVAPATKARRVVGCPRRRPLLKFIELSWASVAAALARRATRRTARDERRHRGKHNRLFRTTNRRATRADAITRATAKSNVATANRSAAGGGGDRPSQGGHRGGGSATRRRRERGASRQVARRRRRQPRHPAAVLATSNSACANRASKLLAVDLDGTLVDSARTLRTARQCARGGRLRAARRGASRAFG